MILDNIVWEISQWVLVSTYKKFLLLNESRSWHPAYISVSTSTKYPSLIESLSQEKQNKRNLIQLDKFYQNQFIFPTWNCWVSPVGEKKSRPTNLAIVIGPVSYRIHFMALPTNGRSRGQWESRWSLGIDIFCLVSSLRFRLFQSWSWSRYQDSDIFGLGLVIETQTFSVSVSSLRLRNFQSQSHHWDSDLSSLILCLVI